MSMDQLLLRLSDTLGEHLHLPAGMAWAPAAVMATFGVCGLLMMIRGARWARGLTALGLLGVGGLAGVWASSVIGTPLWPTVAVTAVLGFGAGLLLFRVWQAALLAVCCGAVALSAYYVRDLNPAVSTWLGDGQTVTLRPAGAETQITAATEFTSLWNHLSTNVPGFQTNFWTVLGASTVAGLVFGLLLPRASRALWAATIGTFMTGMSATALLHTYAPTALGWLNANSLWAWSLVGTAWAGSVVYNLIITAPPKTKVVVEAKPVRPRPATA